MKELLILVGFLLEIASLIAVIALHFDVNPPMSLVSACPLGFAMIVVGYLWVERSKKRL